MKKVQVKLDSRNRICLTKITKQLPTSFNAYEKDGKIILEPLVQVPADQAWLFKPENKKLLAQVQEGIKQGGTIPFSKIKKMLKIK